MARVSIADGILNVDLSLAEAVFAIHGSFRIPLAHVTNAYVGNLRDLGLQLRLFGTGAGAVMTGGIFTTAEGIIFCDVHGTYDCLVIETRGERFPRLAFTLDQDLQAVASEINHARVADSL